VSNFWDDLGVTEAPSEPVEEVGPSSGGPAPSTPTNPEDRILSYRDAQSTSLVDDTPRQKLRDLFSKNDNRLHHDGGELVEEIAKEIGLARQNTWDLLLTLKRKGLVDIVMVNKHRVYTITWNPDVEQRKHEVQSTKPRPATRPTPRPVADPLDDVDDAKLHAALAEAMWLRYEHAVTQIGALSQRVEELEAELASLRSTSGSIAKRMLT
jgi:biotin operon repressor